MVSLVSCDMTPDGPAKLSIVAVWRNTSLLANEGSLGIGSGIWTNPEPGATPLSTFESVVGLRTRSPTIPEPPEPPVGSRGWRTR